MSGVKAHSVENQIENKEIGDGAIKRPAYRANPAHAGFIFSWKELDTLQIMVLRLHISCYMTERLIKVLHVPL
jgi:hypothetical protein